MTAQERLETALRSKDPGLRLRGLVEDLAREGIAKPQIYQLLESLLSQLRMRADFSQTAEESILDVMDALDGWCHPSAKLLPDEPVR